MIFTYLFLLNTKLNTNKLINNLKDLELIEKKNIYSKNVWNVSFSCLTSYF